MITESFFKKLEKNIKEDPNYFIHPEIKIDNSSDTSNDFS